MRLAALAIAGVMILTTEKLDVVVVLVEVEIEVAAALRRYAGQRLTAVDPSTPPPTTLRPARTPSPHAMRHG